MSLTHHPILMSDQHTGAPSQWILESSISITKTCHSHSWVFILQIGRRNNTAATHLTRHHADGDDQLRYFTQELAYT